MNSRQTRRSVYAYPRLSKADLLFMRIGGNGLGNLLFTWARCLTRSRRNQWRMIWPTWYSHKPKNKRVNPYDIRTYGDLFQPTERYVTGLLKWRDLIFRKRIDESQALATPPRAGCVVQFRGMRGKFQPFLDDLELVRDELLAMTRVEHLAAFREVAQAPIGIHIRRGDFLQRSSDRETVERHNSLQPLSWYIDALNAVRQLCGSPVKAIVISDGNTGELEPLLAMENVQRTEYGSSIADLLALSRSRLLIASGSTFSQWAVYLGQVPAIWHPGKHEQGLLLDVPEHEIEWSRGDTLPAWIPAAVEQQIKWTPLVRGQTG